MITKEFVEQYVENIPRPAISTVEHQLINCVERGIYLQITLAPKEVKKISGKSRVEPLVYHFMKTKQYLWTTIDNTLPEDCEDNYIYR